LLERFGGHRAAAGFTARNENLAALRERLLRRAEEELKDVELAPAIDIDAALALGAMKGKAVRLLSQMGPFGEGNPEPTFLSRGVEVAACRIVGSDGEHLRLRLGDSDAAGTRVTWPAIAFGLGKAGVREGQRLDVVYTLSSDRNGDGALEMRVKDLTPSAPAQL
jgi:single-stranded-DNA-specific exonuclease